FTVSPFKERAGDFNVWAMMVPTAESGISRPSGGMHHASSLGTSYDIFGSERYVLTLDNRALREVAQYAPNEFIEILVNNETYGGGGIFGQFSTAAAGNAWADYLFVHEFGHHFAGLADEYYTSPVAYQSSADRPEPWEPNVTALHDPAQLKWRDHVKPDTPLPTSWPKAEYEEYSREYQKKRAALRAAQRPEAEMDALFRADLAHSNKLFSANPNYHVIGAFEGANYEAKGYYRSQMQCLMFDRSDTYCQVCQDAISTIIDLYSRPLPR
ncbi:MAG TPA: M64 family metallopeptidase, partial [Arenimonas sp.]|uniref:M64 family metallopeptidase n=1 Tax=Arenimonas sp. TaxID=1872635 RepID=UPI002B8914BF